MIRLVSVTCLALAAVAVLGGRSEAQTFVGPGGPTPLRPSVASPGAVFAEPFGSYSPEPYVGYVPTYATVPSLYPGRARQYVPYAAHHGFAFYGQPYGTPNEPWSWSTLSGSNRLDRYFYPPLR